MSTNQNDKSKVVGHIVRADGTIGPDVEPGIFGFDYTAPGEGYEGYRLNPPEFWNGWEEPMLTIDSVKRFADANREEWMGAITEAARKRERIPTPIDVVDQYLVVPDKDAPNGVRVYQYSSVYEWLHERGMSNNYTAGELEHEYPEICADQRYEVEPIRIDIDKEDGETETIHVYPFGMGYCWSLCAGLGTPEFIREVIEELSGRCEELILQLLLGDNRLPTVCQEGHRTQPPRPVAEVVPELRRQIYPDLTHLMMRLFIRASDTPIPDAAYKILLDELTAVDHTAYPPALDVGLATVAVGYETQSAEIDARTSTCRQLIEWLNFTRDEDVLGYLASQDNTAAVAVQRRKAVAYQQELRRRGAIPVPECPLGPDPMLDHDNDTQGSLHQQ